MSENEEATGPPVKKKKRKVTRKSTASEKQTNEALEVWKDYFYRDELEKKIVCKITDCNTTVSRWQPYFFKRHFESKHPTLLKELFPEMISKSTEYEVAAYELMFHAVEMVTVNGYPFSILDSSSLRGMMNRQYQDLAANGHKSIINRNLITGKVAKFADVIREKIRSEVKDKMLSIMFDICTKITMAVIGISITFISNDEVVARSLGKNCNFKFLIEIKKC